MYCIGVHLCINTHIHRLVTSYEVASNRRTINLHYINVTQIIAFPYYSLNISTIYFQPSIVDVLECALSWELIVGQICTAQAGFSRQGRNERRKNKMNYMHLAPFKYTRLSWQKGGMSQSSNASLCPATDDGTWGHCDATISARVQRTGYQLTSRWLSSPSVLPNQWAAAELDNG
jgi:hypothetical protein